MPKAQESIEIARSGEDVFDLIHNYTRRLEWDTLLRKAELIGGATHAAKGVRSVCTAKWIVGGMAIETEYITFDPGRRAAVRLTNHPPFFHRFAATLLHAPKGAEANTTTYIYHFEARPRILAWLLEPLMHVALRREIQMRLKALKHVMEEGASNNTPEGIRQPADELTKPSA